MIMKKFYIPIFTALLLAVSFLSQGQVTYNSITSNPLGYTLDDPRFWGATTPAQFVDPSIPPQNPCNNCTINIYADVVIVPQSGFLLANGNKGTTSLIGDGFWLNHIIVNGGSIHVYGSTSVTVNTYVELNGVTLTLGNTATDVGKFFVDDQITMDQASSIRIANNTFYIDANNTNIHAKSNIIGPINDFANGGSPDAGIFSLLSAPIGGENYSLVLNSNGIGTALHAFPFYNFNCGGPQPCTFGIINGPAITGPTAIPPNPFDFGTIFAQTTVLPVQLVQFVADKNDDGSVKLSWSTAQEQNASHFEIERSGDQAKWTSLGSVKAKGYSSTTSNYSFTDKEPMDGKGYYRLKMVDLDQKYQYSPTVLVSSTSTNNQALIIYNNPYSDMIRTRVHVSRAQNLVLTVTDMVGRTYISQNYPAQAGNNYINLQPNAGSSGMYILRIHGDTYDQTVKIEKQ
jgi:hypothetical protein